MKETPRIAKMRKTIATTTSTLIMCPKDSSRAETTIFIATFLEIILKGLRTRRILRILMKGRSNPCKLMSKMLLMTMKKSS